MATTTLPQPSEKGHRPAYLDNLYRSAPLPPQQSNLRSSRSIESVPSLHSAKSSVSNNSLEAGDWRTSPHSPQEEPQFALVSAFDDDDSDDDVDSVHSLRVFMSPRNGLRSFLSRRNRPQKGTSPGLSRESSTSSTRSAPTDEQSETRAFPNSPVSRQPSLARLQTSFSSKPLPLNFRKVSQPKQPPQAELQISAPTPTPPPATIATARTPPQPQTNKPLPNPLHQTPTSNNKPLPKPLPTTPSTETTTNPTPTPNTNPHLLAAPISGPPPIPTRSAARSPSRSHTSPPPTTKSSDPQPPAAPSRLLPPTVPTRQLTSHRCYYSAARNCKNWVLGGGAGEACEVCYVSLPCPTIF